jgi:DNA-binding transcriptional MocR family regulator
MATTSGPVNWTQPSAGSAAPSTARTSAPWRRRALKTWAARLRAAYPGALDCTTGSPDVNLLPLPVIKRAWQAVLQDVTQGDLQYTTVEPADALARELLPRLEADGVPARRSDLVVGSSAQQLMVLAMQVIASIHGNPEIAVAVEEPGYPTIYDTFERTGYRLVGVEVDTWGAVPASLEAALAGGVAAALFTPRAHNPTGASWSRERMAALADVIAAFPKVLVLEDDQFAGTAFAQPGSLLSDRRIEDRAIYIRSFSKAIAPDMRIAVAATRSTLRAMLAEAKAFADGWSPRLAQRALARALADDELNQMLGDARQAYAARRMNIMQGLAGLVELGGRVFAGQDGVNVWVSPPPGVDSSEVIEHAAAGGTLMSSGEPFFIRPGRSDVLRLSVGAITADQAVTVGRTAMAAASIVASPHPAATPV